MSTPTHALRRVGGAAGLVAAVLFAVQFFIFGTPPENDAPASEIQRFLVDNRVAGLVSLLLMAVVVPLFIIFAGALWDAVAEGVGKGLAAGSLLAGALFMFLQLLAGTMFWGIAWTDGTAEGMSTDVAQAGWNIVQSLFAVGGPLASLFLVVAGIAALRTGTAKWTAWVAFVAAAALLVGTIGVVADALVMFNFLGELLLALWILVTSIRLLRGSLDASP